MLRFDIDRCRSIKFYDGNKEIALFNYKKKGPFVKVELYTLENTQYVEEIKALLPDVKRTIKSFDRWL